jgi:Cof subfamily protein (haloacid dehalogenase superfamily)
MQRLFPVRLLVSDLDGTLLGPTGTVSERTRQALQRARAGGLPVVLATGRPPRTARVMARALGVDGPVICCNGALVYDAAREALLHHAPLAAAAAYRLAVRLRRAAPGVAFAVEVGVEFSCEPGFASLRSFAEDRAVVLDDVAALCRAPVTKLIALHPDLSIEVLHELAVGAANGRATVTHSGAGFVEISAPGVDKAHGLRTLCARLGVPASEVVAFGDMPNDLAMLRWAGHAVAVANAHPAVLALVDEVTVSNAEDGVARIIERLVTVEPGRAFLPVEVRERG